MTTHDTRLIPHPPTIYTDSDVDTDDDVNEDYYY